MPAGQWRLVLLVEGTLGVTGRNAARNVFTIRTYHTSKKNVPSHLHIAHE